MVELRDLGDSCPNHSGCNDSTRSTEQKMNLRSFDARKASTPCGKSIAVFTAL
jgi:hypothetical protein